MQRSFTSMPPLWAVLVPVFLGLLAWVPSIWNAGFSFDDLEGVLQNPLINGTRPMWEAFRFDYWHHLGDAGHFRPLAVISLALDARIFGQWAPGYHASGVLLHGLVVLFAGLFVRHLRPARFAWAGLLGLCVFASHPALADAVSWISGRSSPLSALPGTLFGWLLIRSQKPSLGLVFLCVFGAALLGLFAKEDGLLPAALPFLVLSMHAWRARFAGALGLSLALGAYAYLRAAALGSYMPSAPHAPLVGMHLSERLSAAGGAMSTAWAYLVWPLELTPSWSAATWPTGFITWMSLSGWLPWLFALGLAALLLRRIPPASASLALAAFAWIPLQQWVPAGEVFAPRFLYLPLLFLSLALGVAGIALAEHLARFKGGTTLVVLVALIVPISYVRLAWAASAPYSSLRSYSRQTLLRFPRDPHAWNGMGLGAEQEGDIRAAKAAFRRSLEIDPSYGRAHSNLARLELSAGRRKQARPHFEAAARFGPGNPVAWCNLGNLELTSKRPISAVAAYLRATRLAPGMLAAWRGLTRAYLANGEQHKAKSALERAFRLAPRAPELLRLKNTIDALP